jgi:hypothetical protein
MGDQHFWSQLTYLNQSTATFDWTNWYPDA